jgi:hypothetical protein
MTPALRLQLYFRLALLLTIAIAATIAHGAHERPSHPRHRRSRPGPVVLRALPDSLTD